MEGDGEEVDSEEDEDVLAWIPFVPFVVTGGLAPALPVAQLPGK